MVNVGDTIQAVVEKLVTTGKGLIRYQGWVIFVDGVISQETVLVEIIAKKKSYCVARLVDVVIPSPERVKPVCPHFAVCGGCQLQHMKYAEQLTSKGLWAQDALRHMAKLDIPPIEVKPSHIEYGYRQKITLHFSSSQGNITVGYIERDNTTVLQIATCPIFHTDDEKLFDDIRKAAAHLFKKSENKGRITVIKYQDGYILHFHCAFSLATNTKNLLNAMESKRWKKVVVESAKERFETNQSDCSFDSNGLNIYFSSKVFVQNHKTQSAALYQDVVSLIQKYDPQAAIVDLYAGVCVLSQMLAQLGHVVVAVEANKEAIVLAEKSALKNKLQGVTFYASRVETSRRHWPKEAIFILNPPRTGLSQEALNGVIKHRPKLCVYISCMPTTLARDLAQMSAQGYKVQSVTVYDMFPQTAHLETMVVLSHL